MYFLYLSLSKNHLHLLFNIFKLMIINTYRITGPERSVFEGDHPANGAIQNHYLYKNALKKFESSGEPKDGVDVDFWPMDILRSGFHMQSQMMGSYNASFYKLGERTLSLLQDSKSRNSLYYRAPVNNPSRSETQYSTISGGTHYYGRSKDLIIPHKQESSTYQTYLFFN